MQGTFALLQTPPELRDPNCETAVTIQWVDYSRLQREGDFTTVERKAAFGGGEDLKGVLMIRWNGNHHATVHLREGKVEVEVGAKM